MAGLIHNPDAPVAIDGRATHLLAPLNDVLDDWHDVETLAREGRSRVESAHEAHVRDDWPRYLHAITFINDRFIRIESLAAATKGAMQRAPLVTHPDQLSIWPRRVAVWQREDGAVVAPTGTAA